MKRRNSQTGQATIELCIALLGLAFVVIAILFFGGIGLTSIKTLLNGREEAENAGAANSAGIIGASAIRSWNYTGATYSKSETLQIPFLANDEPNNGGGDTGSGYFTETTPSLGMQTGAYDFAPMNIELPSYNQNINRGNMADLANLVFSDGVLPDELNGREEFYTMRKTANSQEIKQQFKNRGWFDFTTVKMREWRSNRTAYPAFGPRDTSMLNQVE